MLGGAGVGGNQAYVAQLHHHLTPAVDVDAKPLGDFGFSWCPLQFGREVSRVAASICLCRRRRSRDAQSSCRRLSRIAPFNAMFRIAGKCNLFFGIDTLVAASNKPEDTRVD